MAVALAQTLCSTEQDPQYLYRMQPHHVLANGAPEIPVTTAAKKKEGEVEEPREGPGAAINRSEGPQYETVQGGVFSGRAGSIQLNLRTLSWP